MPSKKRGRGNSSEEEGSQVKEETLFEPYKSDHSEAFWDVKCILNEKPGFYFVDWDGVDPATGKPWSPSWVAKSDCTAELVQEWKAAKRKKKEEAKAAKAAKTSSKRASVAGSSRSRHTSRSRGRSAPTSPTSHTRPVISRKRRRAPPEISEATSAPASDEEEEEEQDRPLRKKRRIASRELTEFRSQLVSSSELIDNWEEMEQEHDDGYKLPATPPPPTPAPHRPPIKPPNVVHSSPSVITGTQTQTEWSQHESANRPRTVAKSPLSKKSVPMRPVPVVTVEAFKRAKESPASQIEEYSSPERLAKVTAVTEGMTWPEKIKPPIQKRPLEDILSKSKSQTIRPMESSTPQPIISQPPSFRSGPHKAAKGRPGVDAVGSQDPKGNVQTESEDTSPFEGYFALPDDSGWDDPIGPLPIASGPSDTANPKSGPSDQVQELKDTLRLRDNTIQALESRIHSYEERVHKLKTDSRRLERANAEALDKKNQLADATSSEDVYLRAKIEDLDEERAEALQEKTLFKQKPLEQAPTAAQMAVVPNQSTDIEEKLKELEKRLDGLSDSNHRLQVERDYLSDMLKEAREIAGRAEASKAELMSNARIMRETLQTAPKAAEALFAARVSTAEGEAERLRAQVRLLLEQNKLSQADEIRRKAARYSVVELKLREMEGERLTLMKEVLDGEEEREKLSRELRRLKQEYGLAIHGDAEDQTEERYGLVASDAGFNDTSSEDTSQTPTDPELPSNPWAEPVLMDTGSQRMVYVCQWQIEDDNVMCGQIFDRREDLRIHIVRDGHIPKF